MLRITIEPTELWDEGKQEIIFIKKQTLLLEHSLLSISKWESKWCKVFLSNKEKTYEEAIDYIKCMTITNNVDPNVYLCLTDENFETINKYIESPMTATYFPDRIDQKGKSREALTSELIYYWMITFNIPVEFQKWHLNRLLTLIEVCNIKNQPPKKHNAKEIMRRNAALNASRRRKLNSKG